VPIIATIIRTIANQRSNIGALLKKAHQITINKPNIIPPKIPIPMADGARYGMPNLSSHCNITRRMPGHSLSDFCSVFPVLFILSVYYGFLKLIISLNFSKVLKNEKLKYTIMNFVQDINV
jgi:hypothetical protein